MRLLTIFLGFSSLFAAEPTPAALHHCLEDLGRARDHYREVLPAGLLAEDRRFFHLLLGVRSLEASERLFGRAPSGAPERHLLSNAVFGCQHYLTVLRGYAESYARLVGWGAFVCVLLTALLLFTIVPVRKRPNASDSLSPSRCGGAPASDR